MTGAGPQVYDNNINPSVVVVLGREERWTIPSPLRVKQRPTRITPQGDHAIRIPYQSWLWSGSVAHVDHSLEANYGVTFRACIRIHQYWYLAFYNCVSQLKRQAAWGVLPPKQGHLNDNNY